jgi:hypothetical protein
MKLDICLTLELNAWPYGAAGSMFNSIHILHVSSNLIKSFRFLNSMLFVILLSRHY